MKIIFAALACAAAGALVYSYKTVFSYVEERRRGYVDTLKKMIKESFYAVSSNEIIKVTLAALLFAAALGAATGSLIAALAAAIPAFFAPKMYLRYKQEQYIKKYRSSIPGMIESMVSSLKAGFSIVKAIEVIAARDKGPAGAEFSLVLKKTGLGASVQEALSELAARVPVKENAILVSALSSAMETGGNISSVLESILFTIRRREDVERELKTLTSQGVLSGIIIGLLPFMLVFVIYFIDRDFVMPLFTTTAGNLMLAAAVVMELIGAFFIKKIVSIK